jgi:ApbE superfamily uncharacterized protein (UPF0280 family)
MRTLKKSPNDYFIRDYRNRTATNKLVSFRVVIKESDLFISTDSHLAKEATASLFKIRSSIESYISSHSEFMFSLNPVPFDDMAPPAVSRMIIASKAAGVGPMAAVAGAVADHVGMDLLKLSRNVIIENGGDVFIKTEDDLRVGLFAGKSPLSERISIYIRSDEMPLGIGTSSGTVGHSLSLGRADAACVKAETAALADAAATAVGNRVKTKNDLEGALDYGMKIRGVLGVVIIIGDHLGAIGNIELKKG